MLFDSPLIFGEPARSLGITCGRCHNRGEANRNFYIPGLSVHRGGIDVDSGYFNPRANNHRLNPVDIPSLRGIRFTAPYGRDGRIASLREFTRNVIVTEFAGPEPTPLMLDALVAYMNEFDFLPAPYLYRDGRLNAQAPAAARRGEALFNKPFAGMAGRSCATCHIPSAHFLDHRRHDIGSGSPSSSNARDSAFDTPTLLGAAHTAPYFHDGSLATLADVVNWFDTRFALRLKPEEKRDLTAYLEAVGAGERPYETFDDANTRFKLAFNELSTFASTLDTLLPARDRFHAELLVRSVATDLRADASGLTDLSRLPRARELADRLDAIGRAVATEDWPEAEKLWAEYKEKERSYAPDMF
jgi:cytochrome c peroxidase